MQSPQMSKKCTNFANFQKQLELSLLIWADFETILRKLRKCMIVGMDIKLHVVLMMNLGKRLKFIEVKSSLHVY